MDIYKQVFENNKQWIANKTAQDPDFFTKLSKDQNPDFLFIGCADSRVPANEIMGLDAGDVFVHRNIANLVVGTDMNAMSVVQYAVDVLKVKHVVVCGHYGCGGVKAAMLQQDMGLLNGWLRNIRDVFRLHKDELFAIEDEDARYRKLIELNVQEQCYNLIKTSYVQASYQKGKSPIVHGWVYDLHDGQLIDLNIDFETMLKQVQEIYKLEA